MRTVNAAITSGELAAVRKDRYSMVVEDNVLRFSNWTTQTNALLDTGVPQHYDSLYANWRTTDGKAWSKLLWDPTTAGSWALSTSGATQIDGAGAATQYHAMVYHSGQYSGLYFPLHDGSGIQIKDSGGASWGPLFGPAFLDSATKIVRVEACCATPSTPQYTIVAVGTHDFTAQLSTIKFWLVTSSTATALSTIIQMPLTEAYSAWYANAKYAARISAVYNGTTGVIWVCANAHPNGNAMIFSVRNGVESRMSRVVTLDPAYGTVTFLPAVLVQVGALFHITGRISYAWADGTSTAFDCYLTSPDCTRWSIGERNYFIQSGDSAGTLFVAGPNPQYVYYGGNLIVSRALATPEQGYNASIKRQSLTSRVMQWSLSQTTNGADKLSAQLQNSDGALPGTLVVRGARVTLGAGQGSTLAQIGVYDLDAPDTSVTEKGRGPLTISARDLASKALIRHNLPIDVDMWGQDAVITTLANTDGMIIRTRADDVLTADPLAPPSNATVSAYDVTLDATNGLRHKGLNNPCIMYADLVDRHDSLMKATVTMPDTSDLYALPSFAFLFGGGDSSFNGVVIPKNASWKTKSKPRVVKSALTAYDPSTNTGGFILESRYTGLWDSDACPKILTELPSHYTTETGYTHGAGEKRDYACLIRARRVMLFQRLYDRSSGTIAGNAKYARIMDYSFDDDAAMFPAGKSRVGLALSTDVWADKTSFAHSAYGDVEVGLTDAKDYETKTADRAVHYATSAVPAGGTGYTKTNTANYTLYNGASVAAVDLRNYLYAGQKVYVNGVIRTINSFVTNSGYYNTIVVDSDAGSITNKVIYIRSGDYWAQASSAAALTSIGADSLWIDPKPTKTIKTMTGWAAFIGNDPAALVYSPRWVDSDGVTHLLLNNTWDATNPTTGASSWKMVMHHNVVGKWRASTDKGLPTAGRMLIENEIVRYAETSVTLWRENLVNPGYANTQWLTYIPTYYAMPLTQTTPSTTIENYSAGGTDDLSGIANAAGLLCEITGRSAGNAGGAIPNVYVVSAGATSGRGYVVIDTLPAGPVLSSDYVIVSGRGQLGTSKSTHASSAAACYYPAPISATSAIASLVAVTKFSAYSGLRMSVKDALTYLCTLAGMRSASFRNYMTGANATTDYALALTTTPQALPLIANVADFVIDAQVHIDATAWLYIDFRSANASAYYYRLALRETATGAVTVGLQAIGSAITSGGSPSAKWLELVEIPVAAAALCPAAADNAWLKVAAQGSRIVVELNGAPLWTFDLDDYAAYRVTSAWGIAVSYSASVSGNACTFGVPELWNEVKSITAQMGGNTSSLIGTLCKKYYIRSRTNAAGGLEFAQWNARDAAGTLQAQLKSHGKNQDDGRVAAHMQVTGKQPGAYIDASYIAQDGYSFAMATNNDLNTVQESKLDAQLRVNEAEQFALQDTIQSTARVAHQPEDSVVIQYAPGGDAPSQAAITAVITAIDWQTSSKGTLMATYKTRGEA